MFFAGIAFASGVSVETLDEQFSSQNLTVLRFIEGEWAGFIYAPNAKTVLGQADYKTIYGQVLANGITVHQKTKIFRVEYKPNKVQIFAMRREK